MNEMIEFFGDKQFYFSKVIQMTNFSDIKTKITILVLV